MQVFSLQCCGLVDRSCVNTQAGERWAVVFCVFMTWCGSEDPYLIPFFAKAVNLVIWRWEPVKPGAPMYAAEGLAYSWRFPFFAKAMEMGNP